MKKIIIVIIVFLLSGCYFDIKKDPKYAEDAVIQWFDYKNENDDLGKTRRRLEKIDTITNVSCVFKEKDSYYNYIYNCKIDYKQINETVIPLAKDKSINVVVALSFQRENYKYIVYNSSQSEDIYLYDSNLNYNNKFGGINE